MTDAGPPDAAVVGRLAAELELDPSAALTALVAVDLAQADPATGGRWRLWTVSKTA